MVTNSVMLNGITATAVAAGLCTPEDGKVLARRTDPQIINDSMAFTIQCVASVSNIRRTRAVRERSFSNLASRNFKQHHKFNYRYLFYHSSLE